MFLEKHTTKTYDQIITMYCTQRRERTDHSDIQCVLVVKMDIHEGFSILMKGKCQRMLCPHCGSKGHLEQTGFRSEYELFHCSVCGIDYIAYASGNGEFNEPVPLNRHEQHTAEEQ